MQKSSKLQSVRIIFLTAVYTFNLEKRNQFRGINLNHHSAVVSALVSFGQITIKM